MLSKHLNVIIVLSLSILVTNFTQAANVIVFRHAEALHNTLHIFNGDLDQSKKYPLTDEGKAQMGEAALKLKNEHAIQNSQVRIVYVSPLFRTQQTAEIITRVLGIDQKKVFTETLLRECEMGKLEGTKTTEFTFGKDSRDHHLAHQFGGETDDDVRERMKAFLKKLRDSNEPGDIIVVTHGTPARELDSLINPSEKHPEEFSKGEFRIRVL